MNVSEIKLVNFENMVMQEAEQKKTAVINELAKEKQDKLAAIERDLHAKAEQRLKREAAKITKGKNEQIVHKQLVCKQEVLSERQKLIDDVFDGVKTRLIEFAQSDEYKDYFMNLVSDAKKRLPSASTVHISKNDEIFSTDMARLGFEVEITNADIIGGCIITDKGNGIRIDETFGAKIDMAKDNFLETYKLKI